MSVTGIADESKQVRKAEYLKLKYQRKIIKDQRKEINQGFKKL